jgi:AcrR family transcriptional regulator
VPRQSIAPLRPLSTEYGDGAYLPPEGGATHTLLSMEQAPAAGRLPRGRHGLTREQVVNSQRHRMLDAMAHAVAEKGYVRTTVSDVIRRAGVSRETFYEQFSDKESCFLAAYDAAVGLVISAMNSALATAADDDPAGRFDRAIGAYLQALSLDGALARTFLIEVYAAGPVAVARRMELQGRFVDLLATIFDARSSRDRFACEALVAAVSSLVTGRVGTGRAADLIELKEPVLDLATRLLVKDR